MRSEVSLEPQNADSPIDLTDSPSVRFVRGHSKKAFSSIVLTELGISKFCKFEQFLKAPWFIFVNELLRISVLRAEITGS